MDTAHGRGIAIGAARYVAGVPGVGLAIGDLSGQAALLAAPPGPIISFFDDAAVQSRCSGTPYPIVNVSARRAPRNLPLVTTDNLAVGRLAAEHLLSLGYRQFAFLGRTFWFTRLRREGFEAVLHSRGRACVALEDRQTLGKDLAAIEKPVAVFTDSDSRARQVAEECLEAGLHIPADVAIVGVGNDPIRCEAMTPHLSSVDTNPEKVGFEAARLVHELLNGKPAPREPILVEPLGLVVRESSDAVAVDAPALARAVAFVRQHACEDISVTAVATAAGIPRRTLHDLCRSRLDTDIIGLIRAQRIKQAKALLIQTDRTTVDIAESCGFAHAGRFHALFRRLAGVTPGEFRRQRRLR